jgi:hypothetical protein
MLQANSWKQSGTVWVWRYTENLHNFPGWHLTADTTGCRSLLALLDAFAADGVAGTRTINVSSPTASVLGVPNNRAAAWLAPAKFRLSFSATPSQWSFPDSLEPAELAVGVDWLPQLRRGIAGIPLGEGDYSIGPSSRGSVRLWFWWQPTAA